MKSCFAFSLRLIRPWEFRAQVAHFFEWEPFLWFVPVLGWLELEWLEWEPGEAASAAGRTARAKTGTSQTSLKALVFIGAFSLHPRSSPRPEAADGRTHPGEGMMGRAARKPVVDRKEVNRILREALGWQEIEDQFAEGDDRRGGTPIDVANGVHGTKGVIPLFDEAATALLDVLERHALEYLPLDADQLAELERREEAKRLGKRIPVAGRVVEPGPVVRLRAIRDEIRELAKGPLAPLQPDRGRPPAPWREQLVKRLVAAGTTRAEAREALQPDELRAQARKARERTEARARQRK